MVRGKVALRPKTKRPAPRQRERATAISIINGDNPDTSFLVRSQYLSARNIPESRLGLLASLIWEVRHDV